MHPRKTSIETVDADEHKLAEIHKHPIGIILLYIQAAFGVFLASGLGYFLLPTVMEDTDRAFMYGNIFAGISIVLAFIVVVIATIIFKENRLIITDRNITQILQYGLFNRKVSQLNVNNVEDVTAQQNGILATTFNYGTLKIETAGEQMNFHYTFCPDVGGYAKIILDAREQMLGQMKAPSNVAVTDPETIKDIGAETLKQVTNNSN